MIGRRWYPKRGSIPISGGMFRREMRSKRGSLPPKEGDLTRMLCRWVLHEKKYDFHISRCIPCAWQDISQQPLIFKLVTLTLKFDLLFKKFNLGHMHIRIFLMGGGMDFIIHKCIYCVKRFHIVPEIIVANSAPLAGHTLRRAPSPTSCHLPPRDPQTACFTPNHPRSLNWLKIISWLVYLCFIYPDNCLN